MQFDGLMVGTLRENLRLNHQSGQNFYML